MVDPIHFESIDSAYDEWLNFPGIQPWWARGSGLSEPGLRRHLDSLIEQARRKGYKGMLKLHTDSGETNL